MKRSLASGLLSLALLAGQAAPGKKKVVLLAGGQSHGYFAHDHVAGCKLLAAQLNAANIGIEAVAVTDNGFPKDPSALDNAAAVVVYCDGGGGHMLNKKLKDFDSIMRKGVGLACIHYAVETPKGETGDYFLKWMGGYFETHHSVNPHWTPNFATLPKHPIMNGVKPFSINDEWYYHMRFAEGMKGVTPLLTDLPPEKTIGKDGTHSGNPDVREAVITRKEPQHVAWVFERGAEYNNGRGFGFTGGHNHVNWGHPQFRRIVLNAIAWIARIDVPATGVPIQAVKAEDLEANQDEAKPKNWNTKSIQDKLDAWNKAP